MNGKYLTIGQLSAFVYKDRSVNAAAASVAVRRNLPVGSVRIFVQLVIAAISPIEF